MQRERLEGGKSVYSDEEIFAEQEAKVKKAMRRKSAHKLALKDKHFFDSASLNMQLDGERQQSQRAQEDLYEQIQLLEQKHGSEHHHIIDSLMEVQKERSHMVFDSADWAIQQDYRRKSTSEMIEEDQNKTPDNIQITQV